MLSQPGEETAKQYVAARDQAAPSQWSCAQFSGLLSELQGVQLSPGQYHARLSNLILPI